MLKVSLYSSLEDIYVLKSPSKTSPPLKNSSLFHSRQQPNEVIISAILMKRAELGLLEVLGLLVRMPGEGDVTALPCFVGAEETRSAGAGVPR